MSASSIPAVSPRMLRELLVSYFRTPALPNGRRRRPIRVVSPPGLGKTEITYQSAEGVKLPLVELRLVQHETVDITGAIGIDQENKRADWYPFTEMFPTDPDWQGVIYLGETGQLDAAMQKVIMGMIDRGGVAGRRIPQGARFVLDGNRQQDRAGSTRLLTPIENRCISVELVFSEDCWQHWAAANGIDQVVRSYATFVGAREFVPEFNPAEEIHATPRTWAAVSDELQARPGADPSTDNAEIRTVIQALVGPGAVSQFMAFRQHYLLLHNVVDKVFDAPASVPLDGLETSAQHALIGAISARLKERNGALSKEQLMNVTVLCERLPSMTLQTLLIINCHRSGGPRWKEVEHVWFTEHPAHAEACAQAMKGL